jgi:phosphatidylserine/phosphatidylglycerophosphate/cardiolipin synthase-like enzyme
VLVDAGGRPTAVLTGSTNWTSTGLCAQSNNALVIDDPGLAHLYADYWQELKTDTHAFVTPAPLTEATHNVQSAAMRSANAVRPPELTLASGARVRLWKAPNTKNTTKGSAVPPDLSELYSLMRKAKSLVMFGVFLPGRSGKDNIIETALEIAARDPSLLVYGSISDPTAMPNYVPKGDKDTDDKDRAPNPSTYDTANVHVVRASALGADDLVGNFERELLKVGHAIIHDKIVVIDPLDADGCTIMGSHNLGFRASYTNDENLLIIQGQRALNLAYAVHLFDLYDHYRFRAVETELAQRGKHSRAGFLQRDDTWLTRASATSALADYFAQGAQGQRGE